MAKPVKDKWLGARVDGNMDAKVNAYIQASDDLTMGELVRKAVDEYMLNHPLKEAQPDPMQPVKPGV